MALLSRRITAFAAVALLFIIRSATSAQETIFIDLTKNLGPATHRASGFLHGMSAKTPALELVEPLKPGLFRSRALEWGDPDAGAFRIYDIT